MKWLDVIEKASILFALLSLAGILLLYCFEEPSRSFEPFVLLVAFLSVAYSLIIICTITKAAKGKEK